jgi:hypothetical protein
MPVNLLKIVILGNFLLRLTPKWIIKNGENRLKTLNGKFLLKFCVKKLAFC